MKQINALLSFAFVFLLMSCEGPVGPPGPPGFDGLDGLDGADGVNILGTVYDITGDFTAGNDYSFFSVFSGPSGFRNGSSFRRRTNKKAEISARFLGHKLRSGKQAIGPNLNSWLGLLVRKGKAPFDLCTFPESFPKRTWIFCYRSWES